MNIKIKKQIFKQSLINDFKLVKEKIGSIPSLCQYKKYGKFSPYSLINYFGSFNRAKEIIFNVEQKPIKIPKETLINDIQKTYMQLGHVPTRKEYYQYGSISEACVIRHFSSWNKALVEIFGKTSQDSHKPQKVKCEECETTCWKSPCQIRQSKHHFCSPSCSSKYSQKNKQHGTSCSKAEKYIKSKLKQTFPNLDIKYNSRKIIGSELDIFLPDILIAFEINGIFHYKPIFGLKKFNQTQNSDMKKKTSCKNMNIKLYVVDISKMNIFKETETDIFFYQIKLIIEENILPKSSGVPVFLTHP